MNTRGETVVLIFFRAMDSLFGQSGPEYLSTILYLLSAVALFLILGFVVYYATKRAARKVVEAEMENTKE